MYCTIGVVFLLLLFSTNFFALNFDIPVYVHSDTGLYSWSDRQVQDPTRIVWGLELYSHLTDLCSSLCLFINHNDHSQDSFTLPL